jgi:hypothetical protein
MTIEERAEHLYYAERDTLYREDLLKACTYGPDADPFFLNLFGVTFDPRFGPNGKPIGDCEFLLWPKQEDLARFLGGCIDDGVDGLVEKSRDTGVTWTTLGVKFRRWLLIPGFSSLMSTITEDLVYKTDDPDTLYYKLQVLVRGLPEWLKPAGWNEDRHFGYMRLFNPANGNTISGSAPTTKFGRSGRRTCAMLDEWAFWQYGREAAKSCSGTSPCRLFISTPNGAEGESNHFYEMVHRTGEYANVALRRFRMHWKDDPRKSETAVDPVNGRTYFVFQRKMVGDVDQGIPGRVSEQEFAEEYDIDYIRSKKGRIYTEQLPYAQIGKFPFDPRFPLYTDWDFGLGDDTCILWWQWDWERYRYRFIDYYANAGHIMSFYLPMVIGRKNAGEKLEHEADYEKTDLEAISRRTSWQRMTRTEKGRELIVPYTDHFGDPNAKMRNLVDGRSANAVLQEANIHLRFPQTNSQRSFDTRIEQSRRVIRYADIDEERCGPFINAIKEYQWNKQGTEPAHDKHSHVCSALQFGAVLDPHFQDWLDRNLAVPDGKISLPGGVFGDMDAMLKEQANRTDDDEPKRGYNRRRNRAGY